MNRGMLQTSAVQQMVTDNVPWQWNSNVIPPPPHPPSTPLPAYTSPSMIQPYQQPSSLLVSSSPWNESQEFPESWSQLLLGGLMGEDERACYGNNHVKKLENIWEDQVLIPSSANMVQVKQELPSVGCVYSQHQWHHNEEFQTTGSSWLQISHPVSSPSSSITSYGSNVLDFSNGKPEKQHTSDRSSECNSSTTITAVKKAKVHGTSAGQSSFKVRKEKLGDRITALHQLVSPFGKTDTASVLLEAIGYIRFLQGQIAALSSPYMGTASAHPVQREREGCRFPEDPGQLVEESCLKKRTTTEKKIEDVPKKDLRSRGLCLVPVSCTLQVDSANGADFWSPAMGGGFQ